LQLSIEGFRGFADPITLSFDASAVLLWGPNGSGKTSIFDALQWLLAGSVPRLDSYRLRKNDEYLTNSYRSGTPARVEAQFQVRSGVLSAVRRGTSMASTLEVSYDGVRSSGSNAEALLSSYLIQDNAALREVLYSTALLQQDDLRQLLRTKPDERYRQLQRLLGLEVLDQFERFTVARKSSAKEESRAAQAQLERARASLEKYREEFQTSALQIEKATDRSVPQELLNSVSEQVSAYLRLSDDARRIEGIGALGAAALALARRSADAAASLNTLPTSLPLAREEETDSLRARATEASEVVTRAVQARAAARAARDAAGAAQDAITRLAAAALPLLPTLHEQIPCPVCETLIAPAVVSARLTARVAGAGALAAAQTAVVLADAEITRAEETAAELATLQTALAEGLRRRQEALRSLAEIATVLGQLQLAEQPVQLTIPIPTPGGAESSPWTASSPEEASRHYESWIAARDGLISVLQGVSASAHTLTDAVDEASRQLTMSRLAAERSAALPRQREAIVQAEARVKDAQTLYETSRRRENAASSLSAGATESAKQLFRDRFAALEPLMNNIYARLDPHPAFTRLDFDVQTYRSKGTANATVVDEERNIVVNPMLVFSSAQANIVVLAAFLALGWAAGSRGLPFVLLDDPLQALDDVNVLGFSDLARHLRRQRQLVVATHEERFASLLERKLRGRRPGEVLIVHRFVDYSRNGPRIDTERLDPYPEQIRRVVAA
jgi:DNA repair exonuclease SbcCD ATPase subunit